MTDIHSDNRTETDWALLWLIMVGAASIFAFADGLVQITKGLFFNQDDPLWGLHLLSVAFPLVFLFVQSKPATAIVTLTAMLYGAALAVQAVATETANIWYFWPLMLGIGWFMNLFHRPPDDWFDDEEPW